MLELLHRLLVFGWRRHGAETREMRIRGSRLWYAEFNPEPRDLEALRAAARARGQRGRIRPPTMVLFHGLGGSSTSFYPVIPQLRRVYRVIVFDLPGNGLSRTPSGQEFLPFTELVEIAERFVARVAPGGAYLAGNSMGGWIATKIAARRPGLVRGLALLNPGGPALRAEDWVDFARVLWAEEQTDEWFSRMFYRRPFGLRFLSRDFKRLMNSPPVAQVVRGLRAEDFLSEAELAKVHCPSVLVWGENDRFIPEGCKAFYLTKLKGIRYAPVPDCGHCPQLECPDRTAQLLLELPTLAEAQRAGHPRTAGGGGHRPTPAPTRGRALSAVARAPRG